MSRPTNLTPKEAKAHVFGEMCRILDSSSQIADEFLHIIEKSRTETNHPTEAIRVSHTTTNNFPKSVAEPYYHFMGLYLFVQGYYTNFETRKYPNDERKSITKITIYKEEIEEGEIRE